MAIFYYSNGYQDWTEDKTHDNTNVYFGKPNQEKKEHFTVLAVLRMMDAEEEGRVPQGTLDKCLEDNSKSLGIERDELLIKALQYREEQENSEISQIS